METDVTDADALGRRGLPQVETFGGLDIVVANAGIAPLTTVMTQRRRTRWPARSRSTSSAPCSRRTPALPEIAKRK